MQHVTNMIPQQFEAQQREQAQSFAHYLAGNSRHLESIVDELETNMEDAVQNLVVSLEGGKVCVHAHRNTLQRTATRCNLLQRTAVHCNTQQRTAANKTNMEDDVQDRRVCVSVLQLAATQCNTQQHTATDCNTLRQTATHCNTLQHTARARNLVASLEKGRVCLCICVCVCVYMCTRACVTHIQKHTHT